MNRRDEEMAAMYPVFRDALMKLNDHERAVMRSLINAESGSSVEENIEYTYIRPIFERYREIERTEAELREIRAALSAFKRLL